MKKNKKTNKKSTKENIVYIRPVVPMDQEGESKKKKKFNYKKEWYKILIILIVIVGVVVFTYFTTGNFTEMYIVEIHNELGANNNRYTSFGNRILRYGKDGMAVIDMNAEEIWNAAYQISNPILDKFGDSTVIADRNGNQILVLDQASIKGEIYTNLPIEKVSVSGQGVVLTLLKDKNSSEVVCYDSVGNVLLEHQVSPNGVGYPMDVAISLDGKKMMVTYLQFNTGELQSTYRVYSLEESADNGTNKLLHEGSVKGVIMPTAFFVNQDDAVIVTNESVMFFDTSEKEVLVNTIKFDKEIGTVIHDENYVVLTLKSNDGISQNQLKVFEDTGKEISTIEYSGEFSGIKIEGKKIIMQEGNTCKIYEVSGKNIFEGSLDSEIVDIFPSGMFGKYLVISKDKVMDIRMKR